MAIAPRVLAGTLVLLECLAAQTGPVSFEVVSLKPNTSMSGGYSINTGRGGVLTATNVNLRALIALAYDIRDFQLVGGPKWMDSDRYDVVAHPEHEAEAPEITPAERNRITRLRVQAMLADRFQLVVHTETKELPVYALVTAKNGPRLQPADPANPQKGINGQNGMLSCTGITMLLFAERALAPRLGSIVLDKTGLTGEFSFQLKFVDDGPPKPGADPLAPRPEANDPSGPSLAVALQEQLGLKLETQKAPVAVIVVDRAEKASAN